MGAIVGIGITIGIKVANNIFAERLNHSCGCLELKYDSLEMQPTKFAEWAPNLSDNQLAVNDADEPVGWWSIEEPQTEQL